MGVISNISLCVFLAAQSASLPAGTFLEAKLESTVETVNSEVGDEVIAITNGPLRRVNDVIVPKGSLLHGRVETIQAATPNDEGRVRLVFREIELPDGRRLQTWITNSFEAPSPKRSLRYALLMGSGAAAGGLIGGKAARVAGIIGGTLIGFLIAGNSRNSKLPDLTLRPGQVIKLQLGEELKID